MLQELKERPRRALIPLDVALQSLWLRPHRRILSDCILMLARRLLEDKANPLQMDVGMMHQFVCDYAILNASYSHNEPFQQRIIWLVLKRCDDRRVRSLFETLLSHNLPLSSHTLLQFADRLLGSGQAHVGLEIIRNALKLGADPSSFALQSSCVKLLQIRPERDDWYDYHNTVVTELLRLGIRPKVILWTCIVQNAIEAGRYEAAWRWYRLGIDDGLEPMGPTFTALLKGAKKQKDDDVLHRVIDEAHKAGVLPNDLELVFDLLHAVFVLEQSKFEEPYFQESSFQSCLRHYVQYCDIGPLQELGCQIGPASEWQPRDSQLPAPTPSIIGIMMVAYIAQYARLEHFRDFYLRYQDLVTSKHPLIAPLANTDHVSNAFLMRFGDHKHTLPYCTTVIKSMIKSVPFGKKSRNRRHNQTGQPTLRTWNILMRAYVKHGLTEAAEKVRSMLCARGFTPDRVTWTTLISSYLDRQQLDRQKPDRQQLDKVIYAAKAMRNAGTEYDDIVIKALQRIADKPRFFRAMDDPGFQAYYGGDKPSQSQIENQVHEDSLQTHEDPVHKSNRAQTDEKMRQKNQSAIRFRVV